MTWDKVWDSIVWFFGIMKSALNYPLFTFGESSVTAFNIIYVLLFLLLLVKFAGKMKQFVIHNILSRSRLEMGVKEAFGAIFRYSLISIGFVVIFQTAGIDLSTLTVIAGALSVGIGFGLQNITNNFVSGIIILLERPIKVGDRLTIGDVEGNVTDISIRATTVITNENVSYIVPNSELIQTTIINWSHNDTTVRMSIPVGVSYNSNMDLVKQILLAVAEESEHVLNEPNPRVLMREFGDNSVNFELRVWTNTLYNRPFVFKSLLNTEIWNKFKEAGVEIPFPQHDLHIKNLNETAFTG